MANPKPKTNHLNAPWTPEQAQALAKLSSRRTLERKTVRRQVVLFADQEEMMKKRDITNKSEFIRQAIDEKLARS